MIQNLIKIFYFRQSAFSSRQSADKDQLKVDSGKSVDGGGLSRKQDGFTLVEISVSMLIIGLMSTIVLANYNLGRRQGALNRSAQRLAVAIRQAQNYALFSRVGSKCGTPPGGYGVYIISDSQYTIFGDCDGNRAYTLSNDADDLVSAINVESNAVIKSGIGDSLMFEPPIGKFYFNNAPNVSTNIVLQDSSDNNKQKTLTISSNGSVGVQ